MVFTPEHVEVPVGAYVEYEGQTFTLNDEDNFKKNGTRNFEYTLILDAPDANLKKYKAKDQAGRLKFSMTAKPHEHLQMIVDNLNQRESGWTIGAYVDATEKVIAYNHMYLIEALNTIADEFNTEWEINGKEISLRRVEYNKSDPLPLSYGQGNGFKPGVGRTTEKKGVEVLYVQGGNRNIDASKYGSADLLLPKSQSYTYEGRVYITDSDGLYIKRGDKALTHGNEDSLDLTNIYPSRVGAISGVNVVDASKNFYDIIDSSIPGALDYEACLIDGEKMTIIFQTGMLTSREFEVKYIHADRRFEIVPAEIDGQTMPGGVFLPAIGDKYAVFGIQLPDAYISDNSTQTGSSWDMFKEAVKYLYENEETKFTFTGEMDGIWAKQNWLAIGAKIKPGGYVDFSDPQFAPDGVLIRIMGVKDYINRPQSPVMELSNSTSGSTLSSELKKIGSNEVVAENLYKNLMYYTKRRFRDSQETLKMLENAMLDGFGDAISPITIKTMALLIGDESLQFRFVDDMTTPVEVPNNIVYNSVNKVLTCPAGIIQHMTLGITKISPQHSNSEYKFWYLPPYATPPLTTTDKSYYLYAKVSKTATTGQYVVSETAIDMEAVSGYYHFLIGILNSEYSGDRSFVALYGFTEILPGRITTDRIVSSDGQTYFDLANGIIGGQLRFVSGGIEKSVATEINNTNNKIDNLKIANENLLIDSSFEGDRSFLTFTTGGNNIYNFEKSSDYAFNGNYSIKATVLRVSPTGVTRFFLNISPSNNGGPAINYTYGVLNKLKGSDGVYCIRVKAVGSAIGKQVFIIRNSNSGDVSTGLFTLTGEWQMISTTFNVPQNTTYLNFYFNSLNTLAAGDVLYFDCDFFGIGNKVPEGWTASNADIIAQTAKLITLSGATQIITVSKTGVNTPASSFTVTGSAQNTTITEWTYSIDGGSYSATLPAGVTRSGDIVTINPDTVAFKVLTIKASDGTYSDVFTVARAIDGQDGEDGKIATPKGNVPTYADLPSSGLTAGDGYLVEATGKLYVWNGTEFPPESGGVLYRGEAGTPGEDGYTIVLGNEFHTFPGTETAAIPGSAECDIIVYKGATPQYVALSVGALPTGLTANITGSKITFTASSSLISPGGSVDVTIVADGKTFVRKFGYAISFKGAAGISITGADVEFAVNTSATVAPTSGWTTVAPTLTAGQQLWTRTKTTYSSGSPTYSSPANITPKAGADGAAGRSIVSVEEEYYLSTSKVTPTGGSWSTMQPTWENGKYLCTRVKITYSNPTSIEYTTPVIDSSWEAAEVVANQNAIQSLFPAIQDWYIPSPQSLIDVSDGKKGNKALRIVPSGGAYSNAKSFIPYDSSRKYKLQAYVKRSPGAAGALYIALREFDANKDPVTNGNSGYGWYSAHNVVDFSSAEFELIEHIFDPTSYPVHSDTRYLRLEILDLYEGSGYLDVNGVSISDVTEAIATQTASQAYADLKKIEAQAYADGVVTAEEARAIADAEAKANAARQSAIDYFKFRDGRRGINDSPSYYNDNFPSQEVREFKSATAIGVTSPDDWIGLITKVPYGDFTANTYSITQMVSAAGKTWVRTSSGVSTWTAWREYEDVTSTNTKVDAAKNYADLQDLYNLTVANAYADGKVTTEEAARIADVQAKYLAAKALADAAQLGVDDINNPDKLTPSKKQQVQIEYNEIYQEYTALQSQAVNLGISYSSLQSVYNTYINYVTSNNLLTNLATTSNYNGATYRTNLNNYRYQRDWLRSSISTELKTRATNALSLATTAQSAATGATTNAGNALALSDRLGDVLKALGDSAFQAFVDAAMNGEAIAIGGYLKNTLIDTVWLNAAIVTAVNLYATSVQASIVTADFVESLNVTAKRIRTANSNRRIELLETDNTLSIYDDNNNKALEMAYNSAISDRYYYIELNDHPTNGPLPSYAFTGSNRTQDYSSYNAGSYDSRTGMIGDFTNGFPRGNDWRLRQQVSSGRHRYWFRYMTHGAKVGNPDSEMDSYYGLAIPSTTVYDRGIITGNLTVGGKLKTSVYDHRSIGAPAEGFCVVNIIDGNFTLPLPFDIVGSNPIYQQSKLDQVSIGTEITLCNRNTNSTASYISTNPSGNYILSKAGTYVSSIIISPGQTALFKLFYDNTYGARWMVVWQVS